MARFVDAIDLPAPIEQVFDYLADFAHTAEWDPGVSAAERLTPGPIGLGSRFRVTVSFLGRQLPFEYEITAYERPSRLVLTGGDDSVRSIDEISFVERKGGTRVTYEARLELSGLRKLADPMLDLLFQKIGRVAARGLRERVARAPLPPEGPRMERARPNGARPNGGEDAEDAGRAPERALG